MDWHEMNKAGVFAVGACVGVALAAGVAGWVGYIYGSRHSLWGTYMDGPADARRNIAVLRDLRAGERGQAIKTLERALGSDEAVLRGCKYDLCGESTAAPVRSARDEIDAYGANKGVP